MNNKNKNINFKTEKQPIHLEERIMLSNEGTYFVEKKYIFSNNINDNDELIKNTWIKMIWNNYYLSTFLKEYNFILPNKLEIDHNSMTTLTPWKINLISLKDLIDPADELISNTRYCLIRPGDPLWKKELVERTYNPRSLLYYFEKVIESNGWNDKNLMPFKKYKTKLLFFKKYFLTQNTKFKIKNFKFLLDKLLNLLDILKKFNLNHQNINPENIFLEIENNQIKDVYLGEFGDIDDVRNANYVCDGSDGCILKKVHRVCNVRDVRDVRDVPNSCNILDDCNVCDSNIDCTVCDNKKKWIYDEVKKYEVKKYDPISNEFSNIIFQAPDKYFLISQFNDIKNIFGTIIDDVKTKNNNRNLYNLSNYLGNKDHISNIYINSYLFKNNTKISKVAHFSKKDKWLKNELLIIFKKGPILIPHHNSNMHINRLELFGSLIKTYKIKEHKNKFKVEFLDNNAKNSIFYAYDFFVKHINYNEVVSDYYSLGVNLLYFWSGTNLLEISKLKNCKTLEDKYIKIYSIYQNLIEEKNGTIFDKKILKYVPKTLWPTIIELCQLIPELREDPRTSSNKLGDALKSLWEKIANTLYW